MAVLTLQMDRKKINRVDYTSLHLTRLRPEWIPGSALNPGPALVSQDHLGSKMGLQDSSDQMRKFTHKITISLSATD